ncbi:DUF1109 domain-containing protein [Bradyrhizobium sp. CCH5-F6]|jgi:hypothetical protein|uniref:NrsF family protein n=1 Tax=Bradyrhizobium sp. CCH5-F6 TaxID=1768753 RepID=UPI000769EFF8|nr:DUF1109 domain-containing protein [Bradyrhizobium sp. CCH5-F6]
MDTDQLIRTLAADNAHRAPRVGAVLTMALLVAAPLSILIFATFLGMRADVMSAMRNPFFDMKFAVTLSLAIPAIIVSLHLSRPEALLHGWGWLLLLPVGLLAVAIGSEAMMAPAMPMTMRLMGKNSRVCLVAIPAMSLPLLAGALFGLRHGAPSRPALAGLVSAGLAATLYASHCTDDSPLFVATWYTLATAVVTAIGALAGSRVLRY